MTSKFETDEENSQQTRETNTAGGRGRVAGHGCFVDVVIIGQSTSLVGDPVPVYQVSY